MSNPKSIARLLAARFITSWVVVPRRVCIDELRDWRVDRALARRSRKLHDFHAVCVYVDGRWIGAVGS